MAKKAKGSKPKKTKIIDILMALRVVVLALIIISLLLPWYYDKASRGNTSVEATWYLLSHKVVSRNVTLQIHTYSYDDVKPSIPNTVNVWNNTFILMVLALAAWLISLICSYLVKLKYIGNRWSIGVELIAFLIILAPATYFYIYYPS
ncbi:MAG: hypothetical protein QME47_05670, partial [Candidatus Thermoplasmatota archaeon]|nr:hypothetical protein [Candidatus Thermoplasmatota archaeon]